MTRDLTEHPLTDAERRGLHQASRKTGATICRPFRKLEKGTVTRTTADKLTVAGYATLTNGFLRITDQGKHALTVPVLDESTTFMSAASEFGYTTRASLGDIQGGSVMTEPSETWKTSAREAEAEAKTATRQGRKDQAASLARLAKQPGHRNWPTTGSNGPVTTRHDPTVIRPPRDKAA